MPHPAVAEVKTLVEDDLQMLAARGISPERIAQARPVIGRILSAMTYVARDMWSYQAEEAKHLLIDLEMRCGCIPLEGCYQAIWRLTFVRGGRDHDFDALFRAWIGLSPYEESIADIQREMRRRPWTQEVAHAS